MKKYYLIAALFLLPIILLSQKIYYFDAVNGDDSRTSAQAQVQTTAWKTLTKLNSFFSSLVAGDQVLFRRGQTFPGSITATKSGNTGNPITFGAWSTGARPIIDASFTITTWVDDGGGRFHATIPAALPTLATVTFDGVFQPMGRMPKASAGFYNITTTGGAGNFVTSTNTTGTNPNAFAGAPNCVGGQIVWRAFHFSTWVGTVNSQTGTQVNYTPLASTSGGGTENPQVNYGFFLQNHPNTCTTLGEWAYNGTTHTFTMFFGAGGPTGHTVKVSSIENTITLNNFSNLTFDNLDVRFGNTYNFSLNGSSNIFITNCHVFGGGRYSIFANGTSPNLQVLNCVIDRAGSVGINYSSQSVATTVISDTITNTAMISGMGGVGEGQYMAVQNIKGTIKNCRITSSGYMGIIFNGAAQVINNFVDSFCIVKDDGGGIYNGGFSVAGSLVSGNIVLDGIGIPQGTPDAGEFRAEGVYTDDGASNVTYVNNTVARMGDACYFNHNSFNVSATGNTFFDSRNSVCRFFDNGSSIANCTQTNNIFFALTNNVPCFRSSGGTHGAASFFGAAASVNNNLFCRPINETTVFNPQANAGSGNYTLAGWKALLGKETNSAVTPWSITNTNQVRFEYNADVVPKTINLGQNYIDVRGVNYPGTITLAPWTSVILKANGGAPPPLSGTATIALNPVACFGNVTTATLNATGGTAPYQYRLSTGTFGTQNVFTGLGAGTYTFQIRDNAGTVFSLPVTITQPAQISITQTSGTISINGGSTSTTFSVNGGTSPYTYSLDGSAPQSSPTFTGVLAGPHTVTVTDSHNCTNTLSYTLTQPTALIVSATATVNPLLCSNATTTITVTASGATPPYQYSINGGAFQNPNTFTGRGAGTYTLTVKDAAGATKTATLTITAPTPIAITESHTPIVVNGGVSVVTLAASGGTSPYTYSINGTTFQSSPVFNNVPAGTYTATVRDANSCTNTFIFTVTQPSSLSGSASTTAIACFNGSGNITVTATGGTSPYQYSTDGVTFQSPNVFTKPAGTYNITIRDAAGALFTFSQALTQPGQITISESHTPILVNGNVSTVTVVGGSGTGSKQFRLDGSALQPTGVFNNIPAGNHTALVQDANACTNTLVFTITQPSALTLGAVATPILCSGGGSTATLTGAGGTSPYQYSINGGAFQSSPTFSNLPAATYLFTVRDAALAVSSANLTITQPAPIVVAVAIAGDAPTTITITKTGGTAPFTYKLDGGTPQSGNAFNNVPAGNHTVIVTDANGCTGQKVFTVNNPVTIAISFSPIVCNGGSTPVTITPGGGVPPYTVAGGSPQTKTAGNYTFTVTDSRGSTADTTIPISQPAPMTISETHTPILINGNTSDVTFTVIGGTGSKTYSLDGVTFQPSNVFNNVPAGNYTVTVKDANNCINTFLFTITQPGALSLIATPGTISCPGGTTSVTLTASGGTTPYHYRINSQPLQLSNVFTLIPAGTNTFTVQDNFGAVAQVITTITQPAALTISVVTGTILVNGGNTTATGTGGGGTAPYQYSIDGGAYQGSGTFTGVLAGPHTITVKDANNCTNFNTFTITQPGALGLSVILGTITCNGGAATSSTITGSGGTLPYTYSVDGGAYGGSNSFTGLLAGSHTFSIKDAFGSIAQSIQNISQPSAIILTVTPGSIVVNGGVTNVVASASGGGGGIQYSLDGGAYQVSGTFTGVSAGPHTITAKDVSNCTTVNSFSISQPGIFRASVTFGQNPLLCYGITTPMTITPSGGTPPYTITGGSPQVVAAGTYTVHVVDAFNVPFDTIVTLSQPHLTVLVQAIQYPNPILTYGGTADSVWIFSGGGTPISGSFYNYSLDGGAFNLSDSAFKYKFTGVTGGNHTVTIRDGHGCAETYPFFVQQPPPPAQKQTHSWDRRKVYKNQ